MTRDLGPAPLPRCLLVWLGVTAGATALGLALVPHVLESLHRPGPFDELLVACCEAALVAVAGWLWLVTGVVTLDAARGRQRRRRGIPAPVRRVLLVACGAALAGSLAAPSYAGPVAHRDDRPVSVLQGLPLPERASTALHVARLVAATAEHAERPGGAASPHRPEVPRVPATRPRTVVVAPGDTLWALAAASLPPGASDADVAARVALLHRTNRATVGPDPDLILPGQELRLPRR